MGKKVCVSLSDKDHAALKMFVSAGKTERRLVQRAQVILHAACGKSLREIGATVGISWQACLKWRKRFLKKGIEGLMDLPRSGKPMEISPQKRVEVMALACTTPDDGSSQWSTRKLADASGFSKSTVHRILSEATFKPHKVD